MNAVLSAPVASYLDDICTQAFLILAGMEAISGSDPSSATEMTACRIAIKDAEGSQSELLIRVDALFANHFAQRLFGKSAEDVDEEEIADAIRELANTIGGNLKGVIEAETSLSIPEIVLESHLCPVEPLAKSNYYFNNAGRCVVELCGA